jgi:transcriptional accessory protein Tex/SPT6
MNEQHGARIASELGVSARQVSATTALLDDACTVPFIARYRKEATGGLDEADIRVFAENLRELLLAPPLGQKVVLAIDPGLCTGCKVVCLDRQGSLLHHGAIFPHEPQKQAARAAT